MIRIKSVLPANIAAVVAVLLVFSGNPALNWAQDITTDLYSQLKYRFIGPQGNRVIAVAGVPGDPRICYAGSASGGIFKSTDGGVHWKPIFDDQPVSSVGSLAIAPSDPNIIWAGTGETFIRSNVSQGMGVYKSTDAGKTWVCLGLKKTGRIGRIIIHPKNTDIVFAAAMGHCYGPQQERGVFRTLDDGKTWDRVLFVDENTGCSDMVMDPNNPRIIFAGMWPMEIAPWLERKSGGPGGGIHVSRDGGTTWKKIKGNGLPVPPIGKVALTMSASNSDRIYALIESDEGILWRSDDGGDNWKLINKDHTLTQRPAYYSRCLVTPDDENEIYFQAVRLVVSYDGGETFHIASGDRSPGGDNHDMWIDPVEPNRMMIGNDGGVRVSINRGGNWIRPRLPNAQMYHVYVDNQIPYYVYGNQQDGPSTRGPSNSLTGRQIPSCIWHSVGGSESGFAVPDPVDNNIVWSGHYEGML
ncbi:WD40/YVTN/BNR-like repeat-containing protein, partial [Acidobacteriota bacterium]